MSTTQLADDALEPKARAAALDQSRLTHLVGYAATRASVELKKSFSKHLGPLQLKAVEFSILVLVASNTQVNQKQLGQALMVAAQPGVTLDRWWRAAGWSACAHRRPPLQLVSTRGASSSSARREDRRPWKRNAAVGPAAAFAPVTAAEVSRAVRTPGLTAAPLSLFTKPLRLSPTIGI